MLGQFLSDLGRLDIMVNNAGVTRDTALPRMTLEDFRTVIDVHLQGAWLGTRAAAAVMREQRSGSIVAADIWERKLAEIPMARAGDVSEVADAALFLTSNLSVYITGTVLEVTGGSRKESDFDRLNVHGSGISLGHPVGATGGRILATLLREMDRRGASLGLEAMCIGGGQGLAAIFEAVD
jgi:hypothetical protein